MPVETPNKRNLRLGRLVMAVLMLALVGLTLWSMGRESRFENMLGRNVQKARLVASMRLFLYMAAEAEKSAVLAETDRASEDFAARARKASEDVAAALATFSGLAAAQPPEVETAARFKLAFDEYRRVDEDVLALAVQNSNLKAQALSEGNATETLALLERELGPWLSGRTDPVASLLASRALTEGYRILAMHGPHIWEKDDARMDALERALAEAELRLSTDLDALAAKAGVGRLAQARLRAAEFKNLTAQVVALSRKNTNVRSLGLSLDRKLTALAACDQLLAELEAEVQAEVSRGSR